MNTSEKSTRISQSERNRTFFPGVKEGQAEWLEEAGQWRGQTLRGWTGSYPRCGGQKKADKDIFHSCVLVQGWDPKTCE